MFVRAKKSGRYEYLQVTENYFDALVIGRRQVEGAGEGEDSSWPPAPASTPLNKVRLCSTASRNAHPIGCAEADPRYSEFPSPRRRHDKLRLVDRPARRRRSR